MDRVGGGQEVVVTWRAALGIQADLIFLIRVERKNSCYREYPLAGKPLMGSC